MATSDALNPTPEDTPAPAMSPPPVALPALGAYPATGTDPAKDQWLRLADLTVREAQRATSWVASANSAAATNALAAANAAMAAQAGTNSDALAPLVEQIVSQWAVHDGALDRMTVALKGLPEIGGAGGGVSSTDFVTILIALLNALAVK